MDNTDPVFRITLVGVFFVEGRVEFEIEIHQVFYVQLTTKDQYSTRL